MDWQITSQKYYYVGRRFSFAGPFFLFTKLYILTLQANLKSATFSTATFTIDFAIYKGCCDPAAVNHTTSLVFSSQNIRL